MPGARGDLVVEVIGHIEGLRVPWLESFGGELREDPPVGGVTRGVR
ncbi:MAG: hypothetical protein ABSA65_10900 [Acidimicrobiales bacterium]